MTEEEARDRIRERFGVSRETLLSRYAEMLVAEASEQNLIASSTLSSLWSRHMLDSAQLIDWAGDDNQRAWLDVGSGAGLPGLVVAILTDRQVTLCEPRARRIEFLNQVVQALSLTSRVAVQGSKIENYRPIAPVGVVSARAVAALPSLLQSTAHCTDLSTIWVLPKGRNAHSEVEAAKRKWQGTFHVEPSVTEPESGIVIARGVRPR
ncbi:16S rRNA (guanine(527)-N(7))-methyltransferase RsmG [Sphingomonas psychrotolerans]|uniref:Ribosomal RNA small subunit methyltransferase G n=1 Tax=Sphingomonas psychrotolerans TaxID=1327635 RepID=A0ABU3NA39_9SPHN|nr:16S rRNA (guanine(527)-N(7))-methyltransferase RsmG [Sphingomonas psychrotolerans]MDT8760749.1 16S rRNA (guanine(527)-N(7))-methyltransferase RsmG [Sphingomonas psychrotolerans]